MKRLSIVTICLNNKDVIRETVTSVLSQKKEGTEYIVVDGGSNDGTLEVLSEFRNQIALLISEPDNGIYNAINKGIGKCSGSLIGLMHARRPVYRRCT